MDVTQPEDSQKPVKSQEEIQIWLVDQVASLTFVEPGTIDVNAPFSGYGLSSRDAVMLSGDLEEWLNCRLSPTLVYEYPTISALSEHLGNRADKVETGVNEADIVANQPDRIEPHSYPVPVGNMEEHLASIEEITDDEAEALLLEKLNKLNQRK